MAQYDVIAVQVDKPGGGMCGHVLSGIRKWNHVRIPMVTCCRGQGGKVTCSHVHFSRSRAAEGKEVESRDESCAFPRSRAVEGEGVVPVVLVVDPMPLETSSRGYSVAHISMETSRLGVGWCSHI
jgi:hypothetical protein